MPIAFTQEQEPKWGEVGQTLGTYNGRKQGVADSTGVRRLTPRECERLQGFPDVRNYVRIGVCEEVKQGIVKSVALLSEVENQEAKGPVVVHAQIDLERSLLLVHSLERSPLSVNSADDESWSHLSMPQGDFVRLVAVMTSTLGRAIQTGAAVSLPNRRSSSLPSNGSAFAHVSGQETDELASGAEKFTNALQKSLRHITSEAGEGSQGFARAWQTLCCCAVIAMSSFIPEGIRKSNSFDISFEIVTGYTSIPYRGKPAADGPRYKAIGNSMARPVMEWLGERIDAAEAATA